MHRLAESVILSSGFRRAAITILSGALSALALPPIGFFAVLFLTFPVLVWLLDGETGDETGSRFVRLRSSFRTGWLFGMGYFTAGLWWLGNALLVEADEFAWALPLAILGLPAVLALFYGLATALANLLWSDGIGRIFAFGAAFGGVEWLRSFVATGFPWNTLGYGFMPVPLMMQTSYLIGIFGVTILTVLVCSAPALIATRQHWRSALCLSAVLLSAHLGYGYYRLSTISLDNGEPYRVRIVQPSIDQARKMENSDRAAIFNEHLRLTKFPEKSGEAPADVVIWPETTVPFILTDQPDAFVEIAKVLRDGQVLMTGAVRLDDSLSKHDPRYFNSIYAIDSEGDILGAVDKVHLVPFGEYVPFESLLSTFGVQNVINLPGGFSPAAKREVLRLSKDVSVYPLICYEIIFPDEMTSELNSASYVLNVTNDGWFGDTPGPYQHFQQARVRAVESGKYVIRAANTGISAVIDPMGRIVAAFDYAQKGIIDATIARTHENVISIKDKTRNFGLFLLFSLVLAVFFVLKPQARVD